MILVRSVRIQAVRGARARYEKRTGESVLLVVTRQLLHWTVLGLVVFHGNDEGGSQGTSGVADMCQTGIDKDTTPLDLEYQCPSGICLLKSCMASWQVLGT
jgi:hypothetical protein